jgi:4-carboxymuconolactone decarboxylase
MTKRGPVSLYGLIFRTSLYGMATMAAATASFAQDASSTTPASAPAATAAVSGAPNEEQGRADATVKRGRKKMADLWGDEAAAHTYDYMVGVDKDFADLATGFAYGDIWSRPGLTIQQRSMITIAVLTALGHTGPLRGHIAGALHVGLTPDQIKETILHVAPYAGIPVTSEAMQVFVDVTAKGRK